jgi:phenylalanyl-tRNA synthetase alpha chain
MSEPTSASLHPLEQKVLASLKGKNALTFDSIVSSTGLLPDQVRRSLSWLASKKLATVREESSFMLAPSAARPPELALLDKVEEKGGSVPIEELRRSFKSNQEFSAAIGRASSSGWISIVSEPAGPIAKTKNAEGTEELRALLSILSKGADESTVPQKLRPLSADLLKRGILVRNETKTVTVAITREGLSAVSSSEREAYVERLTPEIIASIRSSGGTVKLRPIDVSAPASGFYPGRRHPVKEFINEVREVYLSMGFVELEGDSVQPSFWNFDALFIPQDHPGREMQDTFYLAGLTDKTIDRSGIVDRVASTHENGWTTGSRGWRYKWRTEEARRLVLRTHNTVLTIKALSESKNKEARVFAVSKVYRNENLDYKHLAEFHQMDGIIVGEGLNVRHLMGFLKEFYKKLGMKDVKLWPTFFPYTEPSLQIMGYSEIAKDWIELGGSGVFRPEVTLPMGVDVPVLAWGPGIERLMLLRYGLDDVRELYDGDLAWLRKRVEFASSRT